MKEGLLALAVAAFAAGTVFPGMLPALPAAVADALPQDASCVGAAELRFCTTHATYARGAKIDAFLENRGREPLAGHLSAVVRDRHGLLVERLAEADLSLAAGVRLHLEWDQHTDTGAPVPAGRYTVEAGFAGKRLTRPLTIG